MVFPQVMLALTLVLGLASANTGRGTVYYQNGAAGSCGKFNPDSAIIAAISSSYMSDKSYCGREIQVTNIGSDDGVNGKGNKLTVTIADTCESCGPDDVDFSVGAWDILTKYKGQPAAPGTFNAEWSFT